ncbi:MAG: methionine aminotransferase [Chitinophagaceae bacterium]
MENPPLDISSKLPLIGTNIFTEMSRLAQETGAINLSQGFPDFNCSPELIGLVNLAMSQGKNQYAPMAGVPILLDTLAWKINQLYGISIRPESEITITPGGTYALYTAITAMVHPGDEVIVFEPAYDSYIPNIEINGGIAVTIPLTFPDYRIDWALVRSKITSRTRMILINSPHNPTGTVLQESDLVELSNIVEGTSILLVSDEVYEHLIFDGLVHQTVLKFPELFSRCFAIYSFGKVFHTTGWKMGYCVAPESLTKEFRKVHQFLSFSCNTPMQYGLATFLQEKKNWLSLPGFFQEKRDEFLRLLKKTAFIPLPCQGTYFQLLRFDHLTEEGDKDFAVRMTRDFGVASIPISAFYRDKKDDQVLRFCFAKKIDTLEKASQRLVLVK